ncbi:hypothetical protein OBV_30180 [Oscillibacter valericigenes Sjm18-20]|nr:hypothetical protein OBV_30180 [Oscillibacter valericigenes Sjm18-20]
MLRIEKQNAPIPPRLRREPELMRATSMCGFASHEVYISLRQNGHFQKLKNQTFERRAGAWMQWPATQTFPVPAN